MSIVINTKMPSNCVFCYERGIGKVINCQLIQSGCANCGRHPNCPLVDIKDIKAEIHKLAPERGMWEIDGDKVKEAVMETLIDVDAIINRKVNEVKGDKE